MLDKLLKPKQKSEFIKKAYETFFREIPYPVIFQDTKHNILDVNTAAELFYGKTREEVLGKHCYEAMGRNILCKVCSINKATKSGKPESVEVYIPQWDKWIISRAYPVFDENLNLKGFIEHIQDITRQKTRENDLLTELNQSKLFIKWSNLNGFFENEKIFWENLLDFLIRETGVDAGRILYPFSLTFEKLEKFEKGNTENFYHINQAQIWFSWLYEHHYKPLEGKLIKIKSNKNLPCQPGPANYTYFCIPFIPDIGKPYLVELLITNQKEKSFTDYDLENFITALKNTHHVIIKYQQLKQKIFKLQSEKEKLFKQYTEITENAQKNEKQLAYNHKALVYLAEDLNEMQQELEKAYQQAQDTARELEAYSYTVSHDLKGPLFRIGSFLEMLENHLEITDPKAVYYLDRIKYNLTYMKEMIQSLLRLSAIGKQPLNKKTIKLEPLLRKLFQDFETRTDRKIELVVKEQISIYASPVLVEIVFNNLLDNSIKFSAGKEKTIIKVYKEKGSKTVVIFEDNGMGFDNKYALRIFEPFVRLPGTEKHTGQGIGLATIKRIVESHGGWVKVDSEKGKGTRFFIYFPDKNETL